MKKYRVVRGISSDLNGAKFEAGTSVPAATIEGAFSAATIKHWLSGKTLVIEDTPDAVKKEVSDGKIG